MDRDTDRDTLIRVEQQLKDSVQNQNQILENQREIFQKLERESKQLTILTGDVKGHFESSKIRWEEQEKKQKSFDEQINSNKQAIEKNKDAIEDESKERLKFDQEIKGSARVAKWVAGILGTIATVLSAIAAISMLFKGTG